MSGDRFDGVTLIVQRLGAIEGKLDTNNDMTTDIRISVAEQAKTLEAQHLQLVEHIRRTKQLEDRVKPIEEHVIRLGGALKLLTFAAAALAAVASVAKIMSQG